MGIHTSDITGLILAGGRGSRMGGADKGLQTHRDIPLALHALRRLEPQVGRLMLNANRHLDTYRDMGIPVWPDEIPDYAGPLAGMLAGLAHCETPYLVTVPCDAPNFPLDLVRRLADALENGDIATAYSREDGRRRAQPVFALMRSSLGPSLSAFIVGGERKTGLWMAQHRGVRVEFTDAAAFANANTLDDLERLQHRAP